MLRVKIQAKPNRADVQGRFVLRSLGNKIVVHKGSIINWAFLLILFRAMNFPIIFLMTGSVE